MSDPIPADQFEAYEAMIRSEQIPADELAALLQANPEFARWRERRNADREGTAQ